MVTPSLNKFDFENDDPKLQCVGKSATLQAKSNLTSPSIRPRLRTHSFTTKSRNLTQRISEPFPKGEQNYSNFDSDKRRIRQDRQLKNTIFPAILPKEKTKGNLSKDCNKPRKEEQVKKQRKKDVNEVEIRASLPKMEIRQQLNLGWLHRELPGTIMGKFKVKN